ncbi:MAG: hypothetical protein E6Q97_33605 [Desulfurellales bacterium]|nr:MAG: hypothetical protein E6Q97_33605 [Desulfurellales bacterium]
MATSAPVPHFLTWLVPTLLFLGGIAWAITWAMIRRFIKSVDDLTGHIHGPDGVVAKLRAEVVQVRAELSDKLPRSEVDHVQQELRELLEAMRREALAREDRVLAAVRDAAVATQGEFRAVREEVGKVHARVDRLIDRRA